MQALYIQQVVQSSSRSPALKSPSLACSSPQKPTSPPSTELIGSSVPLTSITGNALLTAPGADQRSETAAPSYPSGLICANSTLAARRCDLGRSASAFNGWQHVILRSKFRREVRPRDRFLIRITDCIQDPDYLGIRCTYPTLPQLYHPPPRCQ